MLPLLAAEHVLSTSRSTSPVAQRPTRPISQHGGAWWWRRAALHRTSCRAAQLQVCYFRAPITCVGTHCVRPSGLMSATWPRRACAQKPATDMCVCCSEAQESLLRIQNRRLHRRRRAHAARERVLLPPWLRDRRPQHDLVRAWHGSNTLRWLPTTRSAARCCSQKSCTSGRGARATPGAKETTVGARGQRWGPFALKLLLEA